MRLLADVFSSTFSNSPSNADVLGATCLIFCAHPPPLGQWILLPLKYAPRCATATAKRS